MEWKSLKDELPPIGKKILISAPDNQIMRVVCLKYTWQAEDDRNGWPVGLDRKTIEESGGYFLEIPPLPQGGA